MSFGTVPYPKTKTQSGSVQPVGDKQKHRQTTMIDGTHVVSGGGSERLAAASALHGDTFKTDPVVNFLLHDMQREQRRDYISEYLGTLLKASALNDSVFDEAWVSEPSSNPAAPPSCSAVWMPPGKKVDNWRTYLPAGMIRLLWNIGFSGIRRALGDFQTRANQAKRKGMAKPDGSGMYDYWYLFFVSTAFDARGQGLASKLVVRFQDVLQREGKDTPIWLEATTEASARLYHRLGFEHVDSWVLGEGVVDATGERSDDGAGVRLWGMIWWPENEKAST